MSRYSSVSTPSRAQIARASSSSRSTPSRYGSRRKSCEPMCMSSPTQRDVSAAPRPRARRASTSSNGMPNLAPLSPGLDVVVRRVDGDLGIHAQRDRRDHAALAGDPVEQRAPRASDSTLISSTPASSASRSSRSRLADAAEDDVRRRLNPARSARNSSPPETMSTPAPSSRSSAQHGRVRVRLERVVHAVRHRRQRLDRAARSGRGSSPRCRRTPACRPRAAMRSSGHALAARARRRARANPGGQYAFAHSASAVAGRPHLRHVVGASAERNSSSGSTRIVAFVSSLICASHAASPHQPA